MESISEYEREISSLSREEKVSFYEILAHNLTISFRDIWSCTDTTPEEKVELMKWLNEIQHRIVAKIRVERLSLHDWSEADIVDMMRNYIKNSPELGATVAWAVKSAHGAATRKSS